MIGVLYESDEWSDHKLAAELANCGVPARLVDMEDPACEKRALACDLLVSRVFASAQFRGHTASLERMPRIAAAAEARGIPLVNPARAHSFECDKRLAAATLAAAGLVTPAVRACGQACALDPETLAYPCVIKPNCGGRTTCTAILRDADEARAFLDGAPAVDFIVEEYVEPARGFLTRIEVVDGACALVVKRSIAANGLSAYRFGSTYAAYDECPSEVVDAALRASRELSIELGSFDVIECGRGPCIIDANSVSNVSEDCTELLGMDLMRAHAEAIARRWRALAANRPTRKDLPMLTMKDVFDRFCEIGCCSFATPDGQGGVESRIAHFFAYDDGGLYLRTMDVKPFYRQLKESGRLAVSGECTEAKVAFDENNLPLFQPGYQMRVSGAVRELAMDEVKAKAAHDRNFNVAVYDIAKYPETRVFALHRFHGELYDYDFAMVNRDHKLHRERFAFGGDAFEEPGLSIADDCIGCGACLDACTFKAIVCGEPYAILGERCDECGTCYHVCPADAVVEKGGLGGA